ncbi:TraC family protein [Candidatus Uhrbacteria bacterium]|nr:TraC family protein [Candidatus Uhrbacteria bacterium]
MQSSRLSGSKPGASTRQFLDISEIKDNCVVLKDGTLRAVLMVASVNFALKSEDEQQAIIAQYVSFLNSLEFPLQIVIQSRRLNIEKYIDRLKESERNQENELLKVQISDYRAFVSELVELGQIMQKHFFTVIPYSPLSDKRKGFFSRMGEVLSPATSVRLAEDRFRQRKNALDMRVDHIVSSLNSMGLKSVRLDTQGLIELYYRVYNPDLYESQKMADTARLRVTDTPGVA